MFGLGQQRAFELLKASGRWTMISGDFFLAVLMILFFSELFFVCLLVGSDFFVCVCFFVGAYFLCFFVFPFFGGIPLQMQMRILWTWCKSWEFFVWWSRLIPNWLLQEIESKAEGLRHPALQVADHPSPLLTFRWRCHFWQRKRWTACWKLLLRAPTLRVLDRSFLITSKQIGPTTFMTQRKLVTQLLHWKRPGTPVVT